MASLAAPLALMPNQSMIVEDVDWRTYSRLLRAFAGCPRVRLTFDRGRLEIMSPVLSHDWDSRFFCLLVNALADELNLPCLAAGSTTLRRQLTMRGIEADECFWIANAHQLKGRRRLNLRKDPPPDLAIEVDVTHSSMDRFAIYAALGVPEVWRLVGDELQFHVLGPRGKLKPAEQSRSFPHLTPGDLLPFLQKARAAGDQNPVIRAFRRWVGKELAKRI